MIFIANFNVSCELADIVHAFDNFRRTNLNILLDDLPSERTNWSVPSNAIPGDTILFMCAKTARNNLGLAVSHIPDDYSDAFKEFAEEQKNLYKQYSGYILACGRIASFPVESGSWWMSDVDSLVAFNNPIFIDEFRSFISVSRRSSITRIDQEQWLRLQWVINLKNPELFKDAPAPDAETLEREFDEEVHKAYNSTLGQLASKIKKRQSPPSASTVRTKVYHRNPIVAAYVKQRANGRCQLCGTAAPFSYQNNEPYLECHHIVWLSEGGQDSIENCVALCPNCHRKMHVLNDAADIGFLKERVSSVKETL